MQRVFETPSLDASCSQNNCPQWDSMGQLNLVVELETEFDINLEPEEIGDMRCFDDVVRIVKSKQQ